MICQHALVARLLPVGKSVLESIFLVLQNSVRMSVMQNIDALTVQSCLVVRGLMIKGFFCVCMTKLKELFQLFGECLPLRFCL